MSNKSCEARLEELILLLKLGVLIVILRKNQLIDIHQRKRGLCATAANCTSASTFSILLAELGIVRIISIWLLQIINNFLASDGEPTFYANVRLAGHIYNWLGIARQK